MRAHASSVRASVRESERLRVCYLAMRSTHGLLLKNRLTRPPLLGGHVDGFHGGHVDGIHPQSDGCPCVPDPCARTLHEQTRNRRVRMLQGTIAVIRSHWGQGGQGVGRLNRRKRVSEMERVCASRLSHHLTLVCNDIGLPHPQDVEMLT